MNAVHQLGVLLTDLEFVACFILHLLSRLTRQVIVLGIVSGPLRRVWSRETREQPAQCRGGPSKQ